MHRVIDYWPTHDVLGRTSSYFYYWCRYKAAPHGYRVISQFPQHQPWDFDQQNELAAKQVPNPKS